MAGRIPEQGETFDTNGLSITVLSAEPQRVVMLEVVKGDQPGSS
jgi:CBS domain containing-hemolysin-like protein